MQPNTAPKLGAAAAVRLHRWAASFDAAPTQHLSSPSPSSSPHDTAAPQQQPLSTRRRPTVLEHIRHMSRAPAPDAAGAIRDAMSAIVEQQLPPVQGLKNVLLDRAAETLRPGGVAVCPGVLWTSAGYLRAWGLKADLQVASILLDSMNAAIARRSTVLRTALTKERRGVEKGVTSHTKLTLTAGEACPLLYAQRLDMLLRWLREDGAPPDPALLARVARGGAAMATLARLLTDAPSPSSPREAEAAAETEELRTRAVHAAAVAGDVVAAAAQGLRRAEGGLLAGAGSAEAACDVVRGLVACGHFEEADRVYEEVMRDAAAAAAKKKVEGDEERLRTAGREVVAGAAVSNSPLFPLLLAKWGDPTNDAWTVPLWHAHGRGRPCPECGEALNHKGMPVPDTMMKEAQRRCSAHANRKSAEIEAQLWPPPPLEEDRPDTSDAAEQALRLLEWVGPTTLVGDKVGRWILRMAMKAEAEKFDEVLVAVLSRFKKKRHSTFASQRFAHYAYRRRAEEAQHLLDSLLPDLPHQHRQAARLAASVLPDSRRDHYLGLIRRIPTTATATVATATAA
eukprot:Rhum_TRINITY_DN18802_c0_g1::Rhum_TRINITY_DN18802_c0_g1_i1::g.168460::m.168460